MFYSDILSLAQNYESLQCLNICRPQFSFWQATLGLKGSLSCLVPCSADAAHSRGLPESTERGGEEEEEGGEEERDQKRPSDLSLPYRTLASQLYKKERERTSREREGETERKRL